MVRVQYKKVINRIVNSIFRMSNVEQGIMNVEITTLKGLNPEP